MLDKYKKFLIVAAHPHDDVLGCGGTIANFIKQKKQNHTKVTYYKRRKPEETEITVKELKESSSVYLYNKLRMLVDPYLNPFIKIKNKKLIIKSFKID